MVFVILDSFAILNLNMQFFFPQEGRDIGKKKTFVPPPRFFNIDEARFYL